MNLPFITAQQSPRPTGQGALSEGKNRPVDAKQVEDDGFSGMMKHVKSDETDSKVQSGTANQDPPVNTSDSASKTDTANKDQTRNQGQLIDDQLNLPETQIAQVVEMNKLVGAAVTEKQSGQKRASEILQNLVSANGDNNQIPDKNQVHIIEKNQPAKLPIATEIDQAAAVLQKGKSVETNAGIITEKALPGVASGVAGQAVEKRLEVDAKKLKADLNLTTKTDEKQAVIIDKKQALTTDKNQGVISDKNPIIITDKTVGRAQTPLMNDHPANTPATNVSATNTTPDKQVEIVQQGKLKTVARSVVVTEKHQETHLPPAVVDSAWNQIGQKITQSLGTKIASQEISNSAPFEQNEAVNTEAKTLKHLKIQLKPENLGTINVKLLLTNGRLDVTLSASDGHLATRLQQSTNHLSAQLKASGISFDGLSIQVADADTSSGVRGQNTSSGNDTGQSNDGQNNARQPSEDGASYKQATNQTADQRSDKQADSDDAETIRQNTGGNVAPDGTVYI